jgi:hypothetical protein
MSASPAGCSACRSRAITPVGRGPCRRAAATDLARRRDHGGRQSRRDHGGRQSLPRTYGALRVPAELRHGRRSCASSAMRTSSVRSTTRRATATTTGRPRTWSARPTTRSMCSSGARQSCPPDRRSSSSSHGRLLIGARIADPRIETPPFTYRLRSPAEPGWNAGRHGPHASALSRDRRRRGREASVSRSSDCSTSTPWPTASRSRFRSSW